MKFIKNKNGYLSIEAVVIIAIFMIFLLLFIAFYTYMFPQQQLQEEVKTLASVCERHGGLTATDISEFEDSLQKYQWVANSSLPIVVHAVTPDGTAATGVTPVGTEGTNYISRDSDKVITLLVQIPAYSHFLNGMMSVFNSKSIGDYYVFSYRVVSERY